MAKILISHPIHQSTLHKLVLNQLHSTLKYRTDFSLRPEDIFYADNGGEEILYIPSIASKQLPNEEGDPSLETLRYTLVNYQPDVLIVGNNAVPGKAIEAWRAAVGQEGNLLIIRRGVDTRAIDKTAARKHNVFVGNLPGINSPYVAKHMTKLLKLDRAKLGSKIAVIGVGNIGKNIALEAIECGLHVELLSPSLQKPGTRWQTLYKRGIKPERVVCAESIAQALKNATYVAISVPWENNDSGTNAGMIEAKHIESLASSAQIVSASVPRIFSEQALALMNDRVQQGQIYVRIDTSKRRADEIKQSYPHIDAAHDQAFATPECQQQLDHAMLLKAREFLHSSFLKTA